MPTHPSVTDVLRFFRHDHLAPELREIVAPISVTAHDMANKLSGPQLTIGLHKLLEAKDCFVRAALPDPNAKITSAGLPANDV